MNPATVLPEAFRRLRRSKSLFALIVVAVGTTLGAAVCAVSFAWLVVARPLPYPEQERLMVARQLIFDHGEQPDSRQFSFPALAVVHEEGKQVFTAAVMMDHVRDVIVSHPAQPLAEITYTAGDYAQLFAPTMAKGRFPELHDTMDASRPLAVISHAAWRSLFDMREDVLGRSVRTAAGVDFEVVGVTAEGFVEPELHAPGRRTAVWLPWQFNPSPQHWGWAATTDKLAFVGRLAPDVSAQAAGDRLSTLLNKRWQAELGTSGGTRAGWSTRVELVDIQQAIAGDGTAVGLLLLAGTVGLVVIVLVNVTHLLVARTSQRTQEFSIRLALGARRTQLFALVLADVVLLMLPAAAVALVVAAAGFELMQQHLGGLLPRVDELAVSGWTGAWAIGTSLALAAVLAGTALIGSTSPAANGALNGGRQATASRMSRRLRSGMIASQVAVAGLLIAVTAGLLREAGNALNERGIDLDRSASAFLYPKQGVATPDRAVPLEQQHREVRQRLSELPGVASVSQSHSPLQEFIRTAVRSGRSGAQHPVELKRIDHDYLGITGQRLATGRNFSAIDIQQNANVALVNSMFAKMLEADGGALGTPLSRGDAEPYTVVGVVDELAYPHSRAQSPRLYLPAAEAGSNFVVKFRPAHSMTREQLVDFIAGVNPGLAVFLYDDLTMQRSQILLPQRITASATAAIALLVMLASALGLYGIVAYTTRLRRTEIGARRAFGARPHHIVLMLARNNLPAFATGCAFSVIAAALLLPAAQTGLGLTSLDIHWPDTAIALASLALIAALACYLSARPTLAQAPAHSLRDSANR